MTKAQQQLELLDSIEIEIENTDFQGLVNNGSCFLKSGTNKCIRDPKKCLCGPLVNILIETVPFCVIAVDTHLNCLCANQLALDDLGLLQEQIVSRSLDTALASQPELLMLWPKKIKSVQKLREPRLYRDKIRVDGNLKCFNSLIQPFFDRQSLLGVCVTYQERICAVSSLDLMTQRQLYIDYTDMTLLPVLKARLEDGAIIQYSKAFEHLMNCHKRTKRDKCTNLHSLDFIVPDDRAALLQALKEQGNVARKRVQFSRCDGSSGWADVCIMMAPEKGVINVAMADVTALKVLTSTEEIVLNYVLEGLCNKEISQRMHRSIRTIEAHRAHIMKKLGVCNLVELCQRTQCLWC